MISDIMYIIEKGISIALIQYFLKTKKVDTRRQNTNFSIVHLSSQNSVTMPILSPPTTIEREIYNMRHTTSERPKESDLLVEKKKGGCPARFRAKWRWKLDMCLWNTDAPGGNKVKLWQKSITPTFWPRPSPRGMWCQWSVSNHYMKLQSKFGYCMTTQTLNIALCL